MKRMICLAMFILAGCSSNKMPAQPLKFTYHPPDSVSFVVELAMAQASAQGDQQNVDSTWTRTQHKQVAVSDGYELTGVTDSVLVFRNGQVVTDPIINLFARGNIVYHIDTTGVVKEVRGYQELLDRLDQMVGADTAAAIRQMVTAEALQQQETATWNAKFAPFVGREMALGKVYCDTTYPNLPVEGRLTSYGITEILDTVRVGSKLCARLLVTSSTNPAELAKLTNRTEADINKMFGLTNDITTQAAGRQAGLSSKREWLLEFETMLSHAEDSRQEAFYYELSGSGLPVKYTIAETQSKRYTYP